MRSADFSKTGYFSTCLAYPLMYDPQFACISLNHDTSVAKVWRNLCCKRFSLNETDRFRFAVQALDSRFSSDHELKFRLLTELKSCERRFPIKKNIASVFFLFCFCFCFCMTEEPPQFDHQGT